MAVFMDALNTVANVLDTPNKIIGDGLDYAYDNTIGAATGTQDLFTGNDLKIIPEIASFLIPGGAAIKGIKAAKNLSNIKKFESALSSPFKNTVDNIAASAAGHVGKYGDEGAKRIAHQFGQYTKADKLAGKPTPEELSFGDLTMSLDPAGLSKRLDRMKMESPVPLYRGGNPESGWFYTPDRRIAADYRGEASLLDWLLGRGNASITKLPKGTPMAPGKYYGGEDGLSPLRHIAGREAIVKPEWIGQNG